MNASLRMFALYSLALSVFVAIRAADPFAENVRTTPKLSPEEERQTFKLPPGFEAQLFASEPDIQKPMNMAFDARGRLWVTDTREYPYPVPLDKVGRDTIKILEDTDGDGKADKVTTFVDGLNIPIGLYPYKNGVIAWSIPNIWWFEDTDGDGKADKREVLYGPLGWERDTHGMNSSFTRGFDGWLYATHGYNNNTTMRGRDGSEIHMNSGNTYRIRLDGSRVEQHTWGQVNPFGLCFDALGHIYSADCHSAPVYELLRGGYYPSFGKPHDGLGFAPTLMEHAHGSTAICGIIHYEDDLWPDEFQNNTFIGNVMTSRINRDTLIRHGATPVAREEPDFLTTSDPWFRPVNNQLGPDGALYVADFYNRIIGHYEVPLNHPGRDRLSGRIWRIVYKGQGKNARPLNQFNLANASVDQLFAEMGSPNLTRRMLAMNQLSDRIGRSAADAVKKLLSGSANSYQKAHGLWVLFRLNAVDDAILKSSAQDKDRLVRAHTMEVLSEMKEWSAAMRQLALAGLTDSDAEVQRAAADALGQHPAFEHVEPLLRARQVVPANDSHLLYTVRMALRNQLRPTENFTKLASLKLSPEQAQFIADVAVAIPGPGAAGWLLSYIQNQDEKRDTLVAYLRHAARYLSEPDIATMAKFVRRKFADDVDLQLALFRSIRDGISQRGGPLPSAAKEWGASLAFALLRSSDRNEMPWSVNTVPGHPPSPNPWFVQTRVSSDGDKSPFLCSLPPGGEQLTGLLRSARFRVPAKLTFYMAGHDGFPTQPRGKKNYIRLIDASSGKTIMEAFPPRNDTAQRITWELDAYKGKNAYLEVVDGDRGTAYAWLAVGRFEPAVAKIPALSPNQIPARQQAAAELARVLNLKGLAPQLSQLLSAPETDFETRGAVAQTLVALDPDETLVALAPLVSDASLGSELRTQIARALVERSATNTMAVLSEALRSTPYRVQVKIAQTLAGSQLGGEKLLSVIEQGQAPARLLQERAINDKLMAVNPANAATRMASLTKNLSAPSEQVQKLIETRRAAYSPEKAQPVLGAKVFSQTCAVCHQIDGVGNVVGPQLDGIGNRGLERILEDVLDPNRNVDRAFRTHIITLSDGDVVTGLPRREEGAVLVLADSTGKEVTVSKNNIQARRESDTSLMPDNFGDVIPPEDFNNLMAYLLSKGSKPAK